MTLQCGSAALTMIDPVPPEDGAHEFERELSGDCLVLQVGKFRNGRPKAWCQTHAQVVRAAESERCVDHGAVVRLRCLSLDVGKYAGGVGIWGSLPPAIDTAAADIDAESLLQGIHVHARRDPRTKKEVDETYDLVALYEGRNHLVTIDTASAISLVQSRIAGLPTRHIQCPKCGADHIDEGWFAVTPHRKHQCLCCGREFWQKQGDAGNAIEAKLHAAFGQRDTERVAAGRTIDLGKHIDAGRHIRIWGTHQALMWTAERPEESGVHVHVYNTAGDYVVDETFDTATWRDSVLDSEQVRLLMLQKSLAHLSGRLSAVECAACGSPITSIGLAAVNASKEHVCNTCQATTTTRRKLVSNPLASFKPV